MVNWWFGFGFRRDPLVKRIVRSILIDSQTTFWAHLEVISIHYLFEGWHPVTQPISKFHQVGESVNPNSGMFIQWSKASFKFQSNQLRKRNSLQQLYNLLITTILQVCNFCICFPLLNDDWFVALSGYVNLLLIFLWKKSVFEKSKGLQTHGFGPAVRPSLQDGAHSGDRHSPWRVLQTDGKYSSYISSIHGSWSIHSQIQLYIYINRFKLEVVSLTIELLSANG